METAIQSTSDDAVRAKAAAVRAGYYVDPFVTALVHRDAFPTVQPIIKRGTFARVACVEKAVVSFLDLAVQHGAGRGAEWYPQVVVMGAGKDTSFLRLQEGLLGRNDTPRRCRWFDVDYEMVIRNKVEAFQRSQNVFLARVAKTNELGGVTMERESSNQLSRPLWSGHYHLIPHDLRVDMSQLLKRLKACGFQASYPTLFVFECCLMYLPEATTKGLIKGLPQLCSDAYLCMYEPILGMDPFGRMMEENLTRAGVADGDSTLRQVRTLRQHMDCLAQSGFPHTVGCDMLAAFETVLTVSQRQHANRCEFLDEMEEWMLIMKHYCLIVASSTSSRFGAKYCAVGIDSAMGFVPGRCEVNGLE